jgi:hypothetical protein
MKKISEVNDELRPEYDMKKLLEGAVRGKYAERYDEGTNLVLLDSDIAEAFPTAESVNEALRLVLRLSQIPAASNKHSTAS